MAAVEPLALDVDDPRALLAAIATLPGAAALNAALHTIDAPVHLVGGAVRDLLIGVPPRELDVVVEGDPAPLLSVLGAAQRSDHERFATATVQLQDGATIDVARARAERYPQPGALPEVDPAPLAIDLHRRDTTLNAIAIDLRTGAVQAPATALIDLQSRVLRVLHPASFVDDPTRLWRLVRHEVRFGADWDPVTWHLAQAAIRAGALDTVSHQRLASELRLALREPDPIGALAAAARLGLPPRVELDALRLHQAEQLAPPECPTSDLVLAAVASDDPLLATYLERGPERTLLDAARALRGSETAAARRPGPLDADATGSQIATRFEGLPFAAVAAAPDVDAARRWLTELRHRRLALTGAALIAAGVAQGEAVGAGLAAARTALLDGVVDAADADGQLRIALDAAC
jgi:tRNA nucleotidyltransferase (CCA-adding enzyme)